MTQRRSVKALTFQRIYDLRLLAIPSARDAKPPASSTSGLHRRGRPVTATSCPRSSGSTTRRSSPAAGAYSPKTSPTFCRGGKHHCQKENQSMHDHPQNTATSQPKTIEQVLKDSSSPDGKLG